MTGPNRGPNYIQLRNINFLEYISTIIKFSLKQIEYRYLLNRYNHVVTKFIYSIRHLH